MYFVCVIVCVCACLESLCVLEGERCKERGRKEIDRYIDRERKKKRENERRGKECVCV